MINTTNGIVFNSKGEALSECIRSAVEITSDAILEAFGMEAVDLSCVSTKTNTEAVFPKFARLSILKTDVILDETYVLNAYAAYCAGGMQMTREQFESFTLCIPFPNLEFKRTFGIKIKTGIGLFLVSLHVKKAITLPLEFTWPTSRTNGSRTVIAAKIVCENSPLLRFVRSIQLERSAVIDDAFAAVGYDEKRIDRYTTYATKLLLASGWHEPKDVRFDELLTLKKLDRKADPVASIFRLFIDTLKRKFGTEISITPDEWSATLAFDLSEYKNQDELDELVRCVNKVDGNSAITAFRHIVSLKPSLAYPERLRKIVTHPGLKFDIQENAHIWIKLEELYLKIVPREDNRSPKLAIATFNLYLFFFLPYWFKQHPGTTLEFPRTPNQLHSKAFISRILEPEESVPFTFVEFLRTRWRHSGSDETSLYAVLKQVENFFDFLVEHSDELPDCSTFKQPICKSDFPNTSRPSVTNKRPIPRRVFSSFLSFVKANADYVNSINDRIISGEIDKEGLSYISRFVNFIVTDDIERRYGISKPTFSANGRNIVIEYMPLVVSADWYLLKGGDTKRLLRPHALNQIIAALCSGVRHNHIQWLDANRFDSLVYELEKDYAKLLVNTDKAKKKPWAPLVNKVVIEVLRNQFSWRSLIAEDGFKKKKFYNNNPSTKYPKFEPLFSYFSDGRPHPDSAYEKAWLDLIHGYQAYIGEVLGPDSDGYVLSKLSPPGIGFNDPESKMKVAKYENTDAKYCELTVKTEITPHSARSTVVSHLITFLPPELIGKHITGQERGTVLHYVVPDPEEVEAQQVYQALDMRRRAYDVQQDNLLHGTPGADKPYVKADDFNSKLARSARLNINETIARYGCISFSFSEEDRDGIDVLKEKGIEQAAFNKTEICPYGNQCPKDVVVKLKGFRRCSLCSYGVRSIDHLPAVVVREKYTAEMLAQLEEKITHENGKYTVQELDDLEAERQRLAEDCAGWGLCISALEIQRERVLSGEDSRTWVVETPEIIEQDLRRVEIPSNPVEYLLSRLHECVAYPGFQSPSISAQFTLLKNRILAADGSRLREAFSLDVPVNAAAECAGVLRSLAATHKLSANDIAEILSTDKHLASLPNRKGNLRLVNLVAINDDGNVSNE